MSKYAGNLCYAGVKLCGIFWQLLTHSKPAALFSLFPVLVLALSLTAWCHQSCRVETTCHFLSWQNRIKVLFSYLFSFAIVSQNFPLSSLYLSVCVQIPEYIRDRDIDLLAPGPRLVDFFTTNLGALNQFWSGQRGILALLLLLGLPGTIPYHFRIPHCH